MDQAADVNGVISGQGQPVLDRAYRINELNKIEQNITRLLRSAGEAMHALTLQLAEKDESRDSIDRRKETFSKAASEYFAALSYVDVHLRREIYALEEANIIPADIPKENSVSTQTDGSKSETGAGSGAMGNLDVGWLNSRNDKVGKDMQTELWTQAKDILKNVNLDDLFGRPQEMQDGPLDSSREKNHATN